VAYFGRYRPLAELRSVVALGVQGIQYRGVQTANPTGYKWIVHLDAVRTRTGESYSMNSAIQDAQRKIDRALKENKAE
jgi:hypothetical protein